MIVLVAQVALTPAGKPLAPLTPSFAIPVAPVVVCVILGFIAVFIHTVGVLEAGPTVLITGSDNVFESELLSQLK